MTKMTSSVSKRTVILSQIFSRSLYM